MNSDPHWQDEKYPYVLLAIPPTGSETYVNDIARAADRWDGTGGMVYIGTIGVYSQEEGEVDESAETYPRDASERMERLIDAEEEVLKRDGVVLRLAGLYDATRGAFSYFLKGPIVHSPPDNTVAQVHYDDAAELARLALLSHKRREIFNGAEREVLRRDEIARVAMEEGAYDGRAPQFSQGPSGKSRWIVANKAKQDLGWEPKWTFTSFMRAMGSHED